MTFAPTGRVGPDDLHRLEIDERYQVGVLHGGNSSLAVGVEQRGMGSGIWPEIDPANNAGVLDIDQYDVPTVIGIWPVLAGQCETTVGRDCNLMWNDRADRKTRNLKPCLKINKRDTPTPAISDQQRTVLCQNGRTQA
jgi:hypothetical protein